MKTIVIAVLLFPLFTGCMFLRPDYLNIISADDLHAALQERDIFLVDVHIPEQKHITGTDLFVPYNRIEENRDKFPQDLSTPIYLYCASGPMGNAAARSLYKLGYRNIFNLDGGTDAWEKAGFEY